MILWEIICILYGFQTVCKLYDRIIPSFYYDTVNNIVFCSTFKTILYIVIMRYKWYSTLHATAIFVVLKIRLFDVTWKYWWLLINTFKIRSLLRNGFSIQIITRLNTHSVDENERVTNFRFINIHTSLNVHKWINE